MPRVGGGAWAIRTTGGGSSGRDSTLERAVSPRGASAHQGRLRRDTRVPPQAACSRGSRVGGSPPPETGAEVRQDPAVLSLRSSRGRGACSGPPGSRDEAPRQRLASPPRQPPAALSAAWRRGSTSPSSLEAVALQWAGRHDAQRTNNRPCASSQQLSAHWSGDPVNLCGPSRGRGRGTTRLFTPPCRRPQHQRRAPLHQAPESSGSPRVHERNLAPLVQRPGRSSGGSHRRARACTHQSYGVKRTRPLVPVRQLGEREVTTDTG